MLYYNTSQPFCRIARARQLSSLLLVFSFAGRESSPVSRFLCKHSCLVFLPHSFYPSLSLLPSAHCLTIMAFACARLMPTNPPRPPRPTRPAAMPPAPRPRPRPRVDKAAGLFTVTVSFGTAPVPTRPPRAAFPRPRPAPPAPPVAAPLAALLVPLFALALGLDLPPADAGAGAPAPPRPRPRPRRASGASASNGLSGSMALSASVCGLFLSHKKKTNKTRGQEDSDTKGEEGTRSRAETDVKWKKKGCCCCCFKSLRQKASFALTPHDIRNVYRLNILHFCCNHLGIYNGRLDFLKKRRIRLCKITHAWHLY